jgi:hypothetical protein
MSLSAREIFDSSYLLTAIHESKGISIFIVQTPILVVYHTSNDAFLNIGRYEALAAKL